MLHVKPDRGMEKGATNQKPDVDRSIGVRLEK
jgi:hypothetical protein